MSEMRIRLQVQVGLSPGSGNQERKKRMSRIASGAGVLALAEVDA